MATTSDHRLRYQLQYSKSAGRYVVKKIMAPKDYSTEILEGITSRCMSGPKLRSMLQGATASKEVTLGEHAGVAKPAKEEAVLWQSNKPALQTTSIYNNSAYSQQTNTFNFK